MSIEEHFKNLHDNPPAPFNIGYKPLAAKYSDEVAREMESEGFYDTHTRVECATEFRIRYNAKFEAQ